LPRCFLFPFVASECYFAWIRGLPLIVINAVIEENLHHDSD